MIVPSSSTIRRQRVEPLEPFQARLAAQQQHLLGGHLGHQRAWRHHRRAHHVGLRGLRGARVDEVVLPDAALPPASIEPPRGGDAAALDHQRAQQRARPQRRLHAQLPRLARRATHRHVSTRVHQAPAERGQPLRREVGRPALRGATQVEPHADRQGDGVRELIEGDAVEVGHWRAGALARRLTVGQLLEAAVVPCGLHRAEQRRRDEPVGRLGGGHAGAQRRPQHVTDHDRAAGPAVERAQLAGGVKAREPRRPFREPARGVGQRRERHRRRLDRHCDLAGHRAEGQLPRRAHLDARVTAMVELYAPAPRDQPAPPFPFAAWSTSERSPVSAAF